MTITEKISDWYWNLSPRKHRLVKALIWIAILSVPIYIYYMPLKEVPIEVPMGEDNSRAERASQFLWDALHADDWQKGEAAIDSLTAAYNSVPDPSVTLTSLLAGAHLWRFISRNRLGMTAEELRDDLVAARRYGERAAMLDRDVAESTAPSILAMSEWLLFSVDEQPDSMPEVHIDILVNSMKWPAFGAFMQGYLLTSTIAGDSAAYPEGAFGYRFMLSGCAGFPLPKVMHFTKMAHTLYGFKSIFTPVCYNNQVAPHNIAGTLLAVGDAYLKAGDFDNAELWYNNTKTSPSYATWKYRDLVDYRLANLQTLYEKFNADNGKWDVAEPAMVTQSEIACGVCHTR